MPDISTTFGYAVHRHAAPVLLTERTRGLLSKSVRMGTVDGDTGRYHGPEPRTEIRGLCDAFDWRDADPESTDTGIVHGPWDQRTASLMVILHRSNVARSMRPEGSTLVPAIGLREHGPDRCPHRLGDGERICRDCFARIPTTTR
jgi:hypothetical protein